MKLRIGWVSNSSSSSFVVTKGLTEEQKEIIKKLLLYKSKTLALLNINSDIVEIKNIANKIIRDQSTDTEWSYYDS